MAADEKNAQAKSEEAVPKKKGLPKPVIFGAVGVVVLVAVAAALYFTGIIGGHGKAEDREEGATPKVAEAPKPALELKEFVVNLSDVDKPRYLKTVVVLELSNEEIKKACEASLAPIRNSILELLSSMTYAQVRDIKGKTRLRQEIIVRLNEILGTTGVTQVYFTDFIIQ